MMFGVHFAAHIESPRWSPSLVSSCSAPLSTASASAFDRVTGRLLTGSSGCFVSLCRTRICLSLTLCKASVFARLAAGSATVAAVAEPPLPPPSEALKKYTAMTAQSAVAPASAEAAAAAFSRRRSEAREAIPPVAARGLRKYSVARPSISGTSTVSDTADELSKRMGSGRPSAAICPPETSGAVACVLPRRRRPPSSTPCSCPSCRSTAEQRPSTAVKRRSPTISASEAAHLSATPVRESSPSRSSKAFSSEAFTKIWLQCSAGIVERFPSNFAGMFRA
mmetsp:Transcript_9960/g.22420  ORF Transcript_9960/g.22420 Transcript_9960/m.22420 type:complete len:280 (+) Transcript_9960:287-1126(+)